ncbi:hypothetical protein ACQ33O_03680 [Ferruginibacter sp. SUN002]|uniref:hypothetical protein n=1 Tax=Ferruginibacter sp. SUN002 TaxID=2937789 RepID=UPI003D36F655
MPTLRTLFSFLLCTCILFACNNKKENNTVSKVPTTVSTDTVEVAADEQLNLTDHAFSYLESCKQNFTVLPNKVSLLKGKKGLKVTVDPTVLEKEDGSVIDGKIKVTIIELTNTDELFKSNATTISNGRLLSSGGSYFIGMECRGQNVRIKQGKSIDMQFPKIRKEEMELFYGERTNEGGINWIQAGNNGSGKLYDEEQKDEELTFTDNYRYQTAFFPAFMYDDNKQPRIYKTLNDPVYYYDKKLTIKNIVDTINRGKMKIYIDTIDMWPKADIVLKPGQYIDTNYLFQRYGPRKQYKLISCQYLQDQADSLERYKKARQEAVDKGQPQTLAEQLQKYYSPSKIISLGWINCDRFYQLEEQPETYFDLPITMTKGSVNYFLLFRSMNGLMSGKAVINNSKICLGRLPVGSDITLVAFAKSNGKIFQCKEDFTVSKNSKSVALNFKNISEEDLIKIFGKNVKI